ncbi:dethiobiotin synthase [Cryptococcus deuterogattii 99/473]|uniref:Dethiobiotin synthase n=2 Tax=Cryptococcus deuterogattii TaxID=1859096 RepID=A0A0D0TQ82_9TREE|nr:dethiobiotin synthase [Cryptococcus deuterogattii R265]KIR25555.1 dethiobiotin synthase [Cryptococcus deuterogattii LA55]KIR37543.1 dethiobiotin synthase [Cryptococcus deuterogattii Ram5]KIR69835.1 dethiobiotin synthase [Cryptococcus deuterogattii CA1014]KIR89757.1 dethiobiotin synthase [Cryptococcus deuterogattii CBS 10090]KIY54896.1 dethiobiotin synthase [Cryptococcus deuterogattii 99/473]
MPLLFPNFRVHQVFGANTEVGKTLLTTALLRASASRYVSKSEVARKRVFYLKPVSTGPDSESDTSYVQRNTKPYSSYISTHNLYQYREPMSPHLAAQLAPDLPFPKTNEELVRGIEAHANKCLQQLDGQDGCLFVETAGGVHSPALHLPHTQSTFLRSLRLPSVLVASPHLGGISTTVSAYESLLLRGYSLSAVLCLHDSYYRNHTFLEEYFRDRGIGYWTIKPPPEKYGTVEEDGVRLEQWYKEVEKSFEGEQGGGVGAAARWLEKGHKRRIEELGEMPQRTLDSVWWPFTQHQLIDKKEDVMVVDSAFGDNFDSYYAKPESAPSSKNESLLKSYFDGSASWFTQSHGHANEQLTLAAASAAGRYGHVLFPSGTNAPALSLAEKLISTVGEGWASRVFYSDNGSTAMEVGLKMALRAAGRRYGWDGEMGGDVGVIGLRGSYHGDTIGSMDATQASTYNKAVDWYKGRGHWFSPPMVQFVNGAPTVLTTGPDSWSPLPSSIASSSKSTRDGWAFEFASFKDVYDISSRSSSPLATYYRAHIRSTLERLVKEGKKFGALVMEPTCLGAGGMVFVDPLFQSCMIEVVRASGDLFAGEKWDGGSFKQELEGLKTRSGAEWQGLPVLYDEVFSGLHRFGYNSAATVLGHTPDISAYAKILTGGLLPMSTTLASPSIFSAFLSPRKVDALLHGHSYTANPIGCAVALEAMKLTTDYEAKGGWQGEKNMWEVEKGTEGRWSFWKKEFVEDISRVEGVKGSMAMGTVFAIELQDDESDYSSHAALDFLTTLRQVVVTPSSHAAAEDIVPFSPFQIHSRPLGNVVYIITSLWTKPDVMRAMEKVILDKLTKKAQ